MRHRLSDTYENSRLLSDAYEPSRHLSDAYDHSFKKNKLTLWFLIGLKEKIHAPSEVTVGSAHFVNSSITEAFNNGAD